MINYPPIKQRARFTVVVPYDSTNYMPYDPELIANYLTDTIDMRDDDGKKVAKLVANEGIISFVDKRGVSWERVK